MVSLLTKNKSEQYITRLSSILQCPCAPPAPLFLQPDFEEMQEMKRIEDVPKARKRCTNKLLEPRYRVMGQELLPFGLI